MINNGWTSFLTTAARLYKYPYNEQLMIHAQRPNATACAEYDFWNEKMGRYVRRNSQGIALIDTRNGEPKLKYVFDVSDTGGMARTRPVWLWQLTEENADRVSAMLEQNYCCNYCDGNCLLLDDGDTHSCVQVISFSSIFCRYFE